MANYIFNKVILNTSKEKARDIRNKFYIKNEDTIDFDKLVKEPDYIKHKDPSLLTNEQLSWRNSNWGTKWLPWDIDWKDERSINLTTAWSPPLGFLKELSKTLESEDDSIIALWLCEFLEDGIFGAIIRNGVIVEELSKIEVRGDLSILLASEILNTKEEEIREHLFNSEADDINDLFQIIKEELDRYERSNLR